MMLMTWALCCRRKELHGRGICNPFKSQLDNEARLARLLSSRTADQGGGEIGQYFLHPVFCFFLPVYTVLLSGCGTAVDLPLLQGVALCSKGA